VEGRAYRLAVAEGTRREGAACVRCDYFSGEPFERCPACGGDGERLPDVVPVAIENAVRAGSSIAVVAGEAAKRLGAEGGMGALLRY
jgi:peptide subunit release factor 1 (eRF1)